MPDISTSRGTSVLWMLSKSMTVSSWRALLAFCSRQAT